MPELFVGVTSWNSALLLPHCLGAIRATTEDLRIRVVVHDNASVDESASIVKGFGAELIEDRESQADALNRLFDMSRSPYTLLLHADVILLSKKWFELCERNLTGNVALNAPEDIGCGPYTRPFGRGKPESSFLFMDSVKLQRSRSIQWRRWHRIPYPVRLLDLYGSHVTHNLPLRLDAAGLRWAAMSVHTSDYVSESRYGPYPGQGIWTEELGHLRYGLGNFYSVDGTITHYHNWYDRLPGNLSEHSSLPTRRKGRGFPLQYIRDYTGAFLRDYQEGRLVVPTATPANREPMAL